jgi:hypothetical protein
VVQCTSTLETTFVINNGASNSKGSMFKLWTGTTIDINAFTVHLGGTIGNTYQVKIWARVGDYFGHTNSAEGWTLIQDVSVATAGSSVHVVHDSYNMRFTDRFLNQAGVDQQGIMILEGVACTGEFSGCGDDEGRIWNGKISYTYEASKSASPEACPPLSSSTYGDVELALAGDLVPMLADSFDGGSAVDEFDWMEVEGSYSMSM